MTDAPVSPVDAEPANPAGAPGDAASTPDLAEGLAKAREAAGHPEAEEIAADDAGGSALAERLGAEAGGKAGEKG